ncbi:hypothetical protein AAVH_13453 [Aphelenchoides avenae]|nr:hypothetical protein AAVH_13453 [Aphelenchus avenae]
MLPRVEVEKLCLVSRAHCAMINANCGQLALHTLYVMILRYLRNSFVSVVKFHGSFLVWDYVEAWTNAVDTHDCSVYHSAEFASIRNPIKVAATSGLCAGVLGVKEVTYGLTGLPAEFIVQDVLELPTILTPTNVTICGTLEWSDVGEHFQHYVFNSHSTHVHCLTVVLSGFTYEGSVAPFARSIKERFLHATSTVFMIDNVTLHQDLYANDSKSENDPYDVREVRAILGEPAFKSQERKVVESQFSNPRTTHTVVDTRDPEVYHIRNQTTDQWLSTVVRVRRRPTSNAFFLSCYFVQGRITQGEELPFDSPVRTGIPEQCRIIRAVD